MLDSADANRSASIAPPVCLTMLLEMAGCSRHLRPGQAVWLLHFDRSSRRLKHLGLVIDTRLGLFIAPEDRWERMRSMVGLLLAEKGGGARHVMRCLP